MSRRSRRRYRRDPIPAAIRARVYARDNLTCTYCKRTALTYELPVSFLTLDHIKPRCRGGSSHESNLCVACRDCNRKKGRRTLDEFQKNKPAPRQLKIHK